MDESISQVPSNVTPGWYTNVDSGLQQYWDGAAWSQIPAPTHVDGQALVTQKSETSDIAVIAFVFSLLVPFVGWILGFKARKDIAESNGKKTGGPLATAAIWIGGIVTIGVAGMIALCAITSIAFDHHFDDRWGGPGYRNYMLFQDGGPDFGGMMNNRNGGIPMMGSDQPGTGMVDPRGGMMFGDQSTN